MLHRFFASAFVIFLAVILCGALAHATDPVANALQQAKETTEMNNQPEREAASSNSEQDNHTNSPSPDDVSAGPVQAEYPGVRNGQLQSGGNGQPTSSIYYPVFGNAKIDEALRQFAQDMQTAYENEIKESLEGEEEKPESLGMWEQTGFFTLEKPNPDIASVTFNIYNYTGGAHGQIYICVLNYNLKTGQKLELADLFGKPEKAIALMSEISAAQLRKNLGEDAEDEMIDDGTEAKESNFANLSLLPDGIAVEFQPYQVGPWSIGQQHVDISLKELAPAEPNPLIWPKQ